MSNEEWMVIDVEDNHKNVPIYQKRQAGHQSKQQIAQLAYFAGNASHD